MARKRRRYGNQPNRKQGVRGESGRLVRAYRGGGSDDTIPPEVLDRRAQASGLPRDSERLRTMDGTNIGILVERGIIAIHHKDAADKMWDVYRRWKRAIDAKPRHPKVMTIGGVSHAGGGDDREIDWSKAQAAYNAAVASVGPGIRWQLVEALVIEPHSIFDTAPRLFDHTALGERLRAELVRGLNGLCNHFGIRAQDAA